MTAFRPPISRVPFALNLLSRKGSLGSSLRCVHEARDYLIHSHVIRAEREKLAIGGSTGCTIEAIGKRMRPTEIAAEKNEALLRAEIGLVDRREASRQVGNRARTCQSRGHAVKISKHPDGLRHRPVSRCDRTPEFFIKQAKNEPFVGLATRRESAMCVYMGRVNNWL